MDAITYGLITKVIEVWMIQVIAQKGFHINCKIDMILKKLAATENLTRSGLKIITVDLLGFLLKIALG